MIAFNTQCTGQQELADELFEQEIIATIDYWADVALAKMTQDEIALHKAFETPLVSTGEPKLRRREA